MIAAVVVSGESVPLPDTSSVQLAPSIALRSSEILDASIFGVAV
jgi:hypothetical protein